MIALPLAEGRSQEIVTVMTIGDHPRWLALGYMLNQNMLRAGDMVTAIDVDEELDVVVVRTERRTNFQYRSADSADCWSNQSSRS